MERAGLKAHLPPTPAWLRTAPWILVALIVVAYAPTLDADFVVWDDDDHIYENRHIVAEEGYAEAFRDWRDPAFYPITFTSWYVEWRVADGQPWLFHVDNIVLHAVNALLLGALLRALGLSYGLAWAIAGVWALHPQQVASVAWLTERKNLLYALFYLASMLVYARSLARPPAAQTRGWLLALVLAVAALMSKATAVTLPIAILLTHWVCRGTFDRRAVARIGAFFALSIVVGLLHVSREEVTPLLPFGTRILIAARAAWFYVGKFLWPTDLVAVYPRWSLENAPLWGGAAFAALGVVAMLGVWQARRIPPIAWLGIGMYAANIALVIGVLWFPFMGYSFVSDHLLYVAAVGLALVFGLAACGFCDRVPVGVKARAAAVSGLWLLLAYLTWHQTALWENTESLWTRTLEVNPESRLAHKNLGAFLFEEQRLDEAEDHFNATLELNENDVEALLNLGVLAGERGDWSKAFGYYGRVLQTGAYPGLVLSNIGIAAARTGRTEQAIGFYERALDADPGNARVWMNLGAARAELGDVEGSIAAYDESLRLDSTRANAHYNRALTLAATGRLEEAILGYERAHALDPEDTDTLYNLGVSYMQTARPADAAERFRQALELDPTLSDVAHNLGVVLLGTDRAAAEVAFAQAAALAPTDPDTAHILGRLRYRRGDAEGAIAVLEPALAAQPDDTKIASLLAWIRATEPTGKWRDGTAAVRLAEQAIAAGGRRPDLLDTLAAALAAAGRFQEAQTIQGAALEATPEDQRIHAERLRRRALYARESGFTPP